MEVAEVKGKGKGMSPYREVERQSGGG